MTNRDIAVEKLVRIATVIGKFPPQVCLEYKPFEEIVDAIIGATKDEIQLTESKGNSAMNIPTEGEVEIEGAWSCNKSDAGVYYKGNLHCRIHPCADMPVNFMYEIIDGLNLLEEKKAADKFKAEVLESTQRLSGNPDLEYNKA